MGHKFFLSWKETYLNYYVTVMETTSSDPDICITILKAKT